ncbi:hypothetical protein MNBD_GAMMA24-1181 [hydrothermal vent metagenome]|uniref:Uncharacterized protein n=1 Tax=hydrothermal vent metagenome TaxID=652676 RepID=A0A3B1C668_9ZZZZ
MTDSGASPGQVVTSVNNAISKKNSCVSIYATRQATEQALENLRKAGIDLQRVSVIGRGCHAQTQPVGFYNIDGCIRYWGSEGAFWSGLLVLLSDAAFFCASEFGPLMAVGSIVTSLVRGLEDVAIGGGFSVFGAALYNIGIPRDSIRQYEQLIRAEQFLLLVHSERSDVERAFEILHNETQQVTVHSA